MNDERAWWSRPQLLLLAILLFAAASRLAHIAWDQNHFFHPDERAVAFAVGRLSFRPLELDPDFFAYGSLPIYLAKITSSLTALVWPHAATYDGNILTGRSLSAIIGTLTVLVLFLLGRRLYGQSVGLLAAALLAACVLHIQNSRFLTVDVPLTFFVLLAMVQLVRACEDGRTTSFVLAGICIGLATATKFSAMPLFLPLALVALHRWRVEGRFFPIAGRCVLAVVAAVLTFALAEPYAVIRYERFYRDIREQSHMVQNAGDFPYTTQYMHTPKYWYDVWQMVVWCMAPPLGLAAVWATITRIGLAWRSRRAAEWILLSWVIPFFLVTGWFQVKFPRYLLPIYPFLILWAADWLVRNYRRGTWFGRIALPVVVASTVAAAGAFMAIYTRPHPAVAGSEWVFRHVPTGSKILTQDWDEGFPMPLPGTNPARYKVVPFGYYERPDTPSKIQRLSRELAESDYIAFQTKRLYGAVTMAPERFPLTINYFKQLFAGDLGFTLVHEVASRPSLFGIEIPDEIADESLTVYDHPKVLIFQNSAHLDAATLADKILKGLPSREMTRRDLLLASPGAPESLEATGAAPPIESSAVALVLFAALVQVLGMAVYAMLRPWLPGVGTLGLCKTLAVLLFAYVSWLLISLGLASFTQGTLLGVAVGFALLGAVAWQRGQRAPLPRHELIATEGLFWGVFVFFLCVRLYNPEIFWGEKPMDFSFLNALTRTTTLPPPEPWFAGSPLYYSYFGYYIVAALGKTMHVHPAVTFNLGIALFAGLTAAAAYAVGAALTGQWQTGVIAAFFATMLGNLAGPIELYRRKAINFDYFWATSRVIRDTINEFPLWSFLFADLHAHVMVMPISLTFLCLTVLWVHSRVLPHEQPERRATALVLLALLCLSLGSIIVTNAWSSPTYMLFFPFVLGTVWLMDGRRSGILHFVFGLVWRVLVPSVLVVGGAYVLYLPFWASFVAPERNFGWERGTLAMPQDFLTIFGIFLFVLVPFLYALWARTLRVREDEPLGTGRSLLVLLAIALLLGSLAVSTRAFLIALFLLALQVLLAPSTGRRWRIPVAMAAFAFAVTAGCDLVFVWDRMNTIFKFYLESWFLLAIAGAVAARALWTAAVELPHLRRVWQIALALLVAVGIFTAATNTWAVVHTNRVQTPKPTLDGMAYLETKSPHELAAFEWLNSRIQGIPVILEAHGDSYQDFTRVSMNTGLPTVLGWGYHVFQRAHPWPDINRRKSDIKTVYTNDNKDVVAALLQRYHVALVFVGMLERRTYGGANVENFSQWSDLLTPVYQNPGVTIFAVNGRFAGAMPVTTIEDIPTAAGEEAAKPQDAPGELHQPRGIAIAPDHNVLVCDFGNHRMQEFGPDLKFIRQWGTQGELPGQFKEPCGVAVAATGDIFVADTWNHRVQVFSKTGQYQREWAAGFYGPRGIAVDPSGMVYIADTGNNRVVRFSAIGDKQREWGGKGTEPGKFTEPVGVAADGAGKVYVADNGNGRLQIFTADGRFISAFPVVGWEGKVYSEPYVTLDDSGTIWVTVPVQKEIRAYDASGKLLQTITGQTVPNANFDTPMGIAAEHGTGDLIIADLEHRVVRIPHARR